MRELKKGDNIIIKEGLAGVDLFGHIIRGVIMDLDNVHANVSYHEDSSPHTNIFPLKSLELDEDMESTTLKERMELLKGGNDV